MRFSWKNEFEAKKGASEIVLSEKTRQRLLEYRNDIFGVGKGSMELTIRQLLDGVERTMDMENFQKLTAFQRQHELNSSEAALEKLFALTQETDEPDRATLSAADTALITEELEKLIAELKA